MPDITVSQDIDDFMQSADDAAARAELGLGSAATSNTTDFAAASHTHATGDITGLDSAISTNTDVAANTAARHTHTNKAILDATTASFTSADETKIDNISVTQAVDLDTLETDVAANNAKVSNVDTNLGYTSSPTNGVVTSSDGTDATLPLADATNAGLLAPSDYTKLGNLSGTNTGDEATATVTTEGIAEVATAAEIESGAADKFRMVTPFYLSQTTYIKEGDIDTLAELNAIITDANLDDASAARTPTAHTHTLSELTQSGATDGQIVAWNNTAGEWQPTTSTSQNWYITKMGSEADDATGTGEKTAWIAPANGKINAVHSGCSTATAGASLTVDVQKNAVTILSTKGVIASADDSTTTGTAHVLTSSPTSFVAGDRISFHIDTFGGTGAKGLHTDLLISWD